MGQPLFVLGLMFTIFCILALVLVPLLTEGAPELKRLRELVAETSAEEEDAKVQRPFREGLLRMTRAVRGYMGMGAGGSQLKKRLVTAGLRSPHTIDYYFAAQGLLPLLGVIGGSFVRSNTMFCVLVFAVVGYMLPDMWLKRKTKQRQKKLRRSLPDAVDLLVICVDAGLGLDQALLRVGDELAVSHPEINEELLQVNFEQRAGKPRLEAWQDLADRVKVDEITSFVNMLVQTDRFGTPILKSLVRFSEDLRQGRRQHAEEAAAKTKIKIIFPLVICIFPCLFIVLLAPALMSISDGIKSLSN